MRTSLVKSSPRVTFPRKETNNPAHYRPVHLLFAQREAADTKRRLYLRQSELETELEDLNAHHDALRVEIARMDAAAADADASLPSSSSLSGRGGGVGDAAGRKSAGRDPAAIGAEVGGAVGGVLRGRFWSGWRGGGGGPSDTAEGAVGREEAAKKAGGADATQEVCECLDFALFLFLQLFVYHADFYRFDDVQTLLLEKSQTELIMDVVLVAVQTLRPHYGRRVRSARLLQ